MRYRLKCPANRNVFKTIRRFEALTSRVNGLRSGYLSVRTAEGASEKQSSLKARLRNGLLLTYLLTYLQSNDGVNNFLIVVTHHQSNPDLSS